jgi:hypothetical protein
MVGWYNTADLPRLQVCVLRFCFSQENYCGSICALRHSSFALLQPLLLVLQSASTHLSRQLSSYHATQNVLWLYVL